MRKILKSKLNGGNVINAINTRAVAIIRYGAGIIKWKKRGIEKYLPKSKKADEYASSAPCSSGCGQVVHQKSRGRKGYDKC